MVYLKRILASLLAAFLVVAQVTSIPDTAVMGASNLTTAGACVYVASSGTLAQDSPGCHWDATNNRLGLGTASPSYTLHLVGDNSTAASASIFINDGGNRLLLLRAPNSASGSFIGTASGHTTFLGSNGTPYAAITSSGAFGIGSSNTSPTGTLHVYDATASTGVTTLTVRAGAGQSTTNALAFAINSGAVRGYIYSPDGATYTARFYDFVTVNEGAAVNDASAAGLFSLGSGGALKWSSTSIYSGTKDLGLSRSSANNLGITNGSSTNYALIGSNGILPGADNTYDLGSSAASFRSAYIDTDVIAATTSFYYWGPTGSDGSWRMGLSGGNMVIQKRESGSWVTKSTVTP